MAHVRHYAFAIANKTARVANKRAIIICTRLNSTLPEENRYTLQNDNVMKESDDVTEPPRRPAVKVNKSRLLPQHRNILRNEVPYAEPHSWVHLTEKYQRSMFGRYGKKSGVNPRTCFPIKEDQVKEANKEKIAFPSTVPELMAELAEERKAKQEEIQQREMAIAKKIEKLDMWKKELHDKIAKKEADALAVKERKERLIEEVRRHFGFKVDPRDERFKELLEQKEKEDKKKQKEAKRKAKEEKLIAKLVQKE